MIYKKRLRNNRFFKALAASGAVLIFYGIHTITSWGMLKSSGHKGADDFIDQALVLDWATCFERFGNEIYRTDLNPANCGGFIYSVELLRILNSFNFTREDSFFLGSLFMWSTISTLCLVFFVIKDLGKNQYAIALIACLSPGVWLLLERGNYDEVIFCLVVVAGIFMGSKRQVFGVLLLGLSVLIKFYTLPAFLIAIFMLRNRKTKKVFLLLAIPLSFYTLKLILLVPAFPSTWNVSFGLKSFGLYLEFAVQRLIDIDFILPSVLTPVPGLVALIFFIILMVKNEIQPSIRIGSPDKTAKIGYLYNLILVVFLSCYFAGMNFDYRLIYVSFLVSVSSVIFYGNRYSAIMIVSGLTALIFNTYLFGLNGLPALAVQIVGDLSLNLYVATQLIYILRSTWVNRKEIQDLCKGDFLKGLLQKF